MFYVECLKFVQSSINRTNENKVVRFKDPFKNDPREKRCVTHRLRAEGWARHELVTLVVKDSVKTKGNYNKCS